MAHPPRVHPPPGSDPNRRTHEKGQLRHAQGVFQMRVCPRGLLPQGLAFPGRHTARFGRLWDHAGRLGGKQSHACRLGRCAVLTKSSRKTPPGALPFPPGTAGVFPSSRRRPVFAREIRQPGRRQSDSA